MRLNTALFAALAFLAADPARSSQPSAPATAGASLTPLTAEELFRPTTIGQAELSPDGRHLAAIVADKDDGRSLLIINLKDRTTTGLRAADRLDVANFRWLGDDRVLFNVSRNKIYSLGLFTAKLDRMDRHYAINSFDVTQIIGVPRNRPGRVLVWIVRSAEDGGDPGDLVEFDALRAPHAFRPSSATSVVRRFTAPKGTVVGWRANYEGELAFCETWSQGGAHLHRYQPDTRTWQPLNLDPDTVTPMGVDPDGRHLWVVTQAKDAGYQLRRYDLDTGEFAPAVLSDASYDLSEGRLYFSRKTRELVGISYTQRARTSVWFAKDYGSYQATVDQAYPATTNVLIDRNQSETKFLFLLTGPQEPGTYALLDLEAGTLGQVTTAAPWLKDRPLLPMHPISFHTRDHVRLEGYLTLPPNASEQNRVPLVVIAHGGPWARATADFDPEAQFYASRGYAVLQPNYRGSTGYTPAISDEHKFDFRRMHDDVTDATRAMLRNPMIDPTRVAIVGASFGGYLALTGVTFENGLYHCAVSTCGVFDWERLIKSKRSGGRPGEYEFLVDKLGRPGRDRDRLEEISPLAHADKIRGPVLIAHGTDDHVVDIGQSKKLVSALRKRGVPHETFFRSLEGHGFYNYKNRVEYYHQVEAFLAAHLGGVSLAPVKASRR